MTGVSLFAGIGGFDLAAQRCGVDITAQAEKDANCRSVLRRHFPGTRLIEDVRDADGTEFRGVGIVCAGFPCQDISLAGGRAGLAGARSGLFWELVRFLRESAPVWLWLENVFGLLSSGERRDMGAVVWALGELGYGYAWRVFDAQWFGVPQRRRRVFVVGCLGDARRAASVLFESARMPWHSHTRETARQNDPGPAAHRAGACGERDVINSLTAGLGSGGPDLAHAEAGWIVSTLPACHPGKDAGCASARHLIPTHEVSPCLQERGYKGADSDCKQAFAVIQDVPVGFDAQQAHHQALQPRDTMHTLTAKTSHSVAYQCQGSNVGPMGTLRAGNGNATGGVPFVASSVGSKWAVRRLMPIECERCQGFPDNWTAQGVDEAGNVVEISDSQRYRMIGNSVSPPNAEWIMRRIVEVA